MNTTIKINRTYLESLSTADLLSLAEDNGLDIPPVLPRQIIIGEILYDVQSVLNIPLSDPAVYAPADAFAFNQNSISFLLRNPAWGYVSWNIRESDKKDLVSKYGFSGFFLRVYTVSSSAAGGGTDYYDIAIGTNDKSWFIYLDTMAFSYRVCLCVMINREMVELAASREILMPASTLASISNSIADKNLPLLSLSGIEDAYKLQFRQHRQTFQ